VRKITATVEPYDQGKTSGQLTTSIT